jgi:putative ABC transport system permease protein
VTDLTGHPVILIDNLRVSVIEIVEDTAGSSAALTSVTIPAEYARTRFAPPGQEETMIIATARGASGTVADQVALALDPRHPEAYRVVPPPAPTVVRDRVNTSTQTLFYARAGIGVLVSGVGIANVSLIGVIARSREIALRRSLGALPRYIAAQFLLGSAVRGLLGGTIGTAIAVVAVTLVGISQQWSVVIEPWSLLVGPTMGITLGMLAGLYPAIKATRIQPIEAFRQ